MNVTVDDIRQAMLAMGPCKAKQVARALGVPLREVNQLMYRHDDVFARSTDVPPLFELREECSFPVPRQHEAASSDVGRPPTPTIATRCRWSRKDELHVGRLRLDVASARAEVPARLRDQDQYNDLLRQADEELDGADTMQDPRGIEVVEDLLSRARALALDVN